MTRDAALSDDQWARIELLMPSSGGRAGRPFRDHPRVMEGIICRYRAGIPWRDLVADDPDRTLGDKAYSFTAIRKPLRDRGIQAGIPEPADQIANRKRRGSRGGRPPPLYREFYRCRNVMKRSFNDIKQWRGIATLYDKSAITYRGGVVLRAIIIWLNAIRDTP